MTCPLHETLAADDGGLKQQYPDHFAAASAAALLTGDDHFEKVDPGIAVWAKVLAAISPFLKNRSNG